MSHNEVLISTLSKAASNTDSVKTIIPHQIIKKMKLKPYMKVKWEITDGKLIITIIKKRELKQMEKKKKKTTTIPIKKSKMVNTSVVTAEPFEEELTG